MAGMQVRRLTVRRAAADKRVRRPAETPGPIVKWVGGKTRLLDELVSRAPARFRRYYEPFCGGGAMFFHLAPSRASLTDSNRDLIEMYRCVAEDVDAVIRKLARHRRQHDADHYYRVRTRWNERCRRQDRAARAAAFIYLNKTCYNGLWRVNRRGLFNVPVGRYESPQIYDPASLRAAAEALQRADLGHGDYAQGVENAGSGDFVYFDPPYHPVSDTARFTSYTAADFGPDDQRRLSELARELDGRGCAVMLSNSDTPFIRELYRGFRIEQVMCTRAINSKASKRGAVAELIITNEY